MRAPVRTTVFLVIGLLLVPRAASSHPAPFSYLDLQIGNDAIEGSLVIHIIDAAHELGISPAEGLLDRGVAAANRERIAAFVTQRLMLRADAPLSFVSKT